jgi:hypothetical protein
MKLPSWMTETEEQRLVRQAKQAEEQKQRQLKAEQQRLHKVQSDKKMIQNFSSSTTDSNGRHHIKRWWKLVSLEAKA